MSIIHDALKKVQNSKPSSPEGEGPVSGAPDAEQLRSGIASASSPGIPKLILIILMVVVTFVVIVLFAVLIRLARQTTVHPKIIPEVPPTTVTVSVADTSQPPALPLDSLKLEGIMNMGDKKVALINGNIYEEGQTVEDMTIVKVTETNVTVQKDGVEKVLKIKQ